jgi:hypothetical protein
LPGDLPLVLSDLLDLVAAGRGDHAGLIHFEASSRMAAIRALGRRDYPTTLLGFTKAIGPSGTQRIEKIGQTIQQINHL